jgi:hypothetical protein
MEPFGCAPHRGLHFVGAQLVLRACLETIGNPDQRDSSYACGAVAGGAHALRDHLAEFDEIADDPGTSGGSFPAIELDECVDTRQRLMRGAFGNQDVDVGTHQLTNFAERPASGGIQPSTPARTDRDEPRTARVH